MAFEFNCVHCGYYLKTDDQEIAEATQCPVCGNAVESPSDASALPPGIGVGDDLSGQDNAPEPSAQSVSPGRLEIDDVFSTAWAMFKDRMGGDRGRWRVDPRDRTGDFQYPHEYCSEHVTGKPAA